MSDIEERSSLAHDYLLNGEYDKALQLHEEIYRDRKKPHWMFGIGVAKLCLTDYAGAYSIFNQILEEVPHVGDIHFISLGVCKWCQGAPASCLEIWRQGLACNYTDAAGGMSIPLLLMFAGACLGDESLRKDGEGRIEKKLKRFSVNANWPVPIGKFMLGQMSVSEVANVFLRYPEQNRPWHESIFGFYRGVNALRDGNPSECREYFENLVNMVPRNICTEWFLARYELEKDGSG